ncbi:DNA ligase D [Parasphingorhabdus sp. JC815]|uniref:DNA ligase D n=1 Tax=Parasphingorhabdus sp. JC815 TaxID=3232140 RepID=UPI0034596770
MSKKPDPLAAYNHKRDFDKTREPAGKLAKADGNRFIVQKHAASRLHFDLRLEIDRVLKSWAVTKGPSLNPDDKRLAVRTEDHPLSYAEFEGTIPKGEYGGGTVMLWDTGTWAPVKGKSSDDLEKGHLHFVLMGERMKGEWLLVRMRGRKGEKRENWLLRKIDDEYAAGSDDLVAGELASVRTGRVMAEIAADEDGEFSLEEGDDLAGAMKASEDNNKTKSKAGTPKKKSGYGALPQFQKPQLATLVDTVPAGNDWLHEIKYDGYRCLLAVAGDKVRIYTRSGKDWTDKFPEIAEAAAGLRLDSALIDGEIVKLDGNGNPDFSALQKALKEDAGGLSLFVFDLLENQGEDLTKLSTIERKHRLEALIGDGNAAIRLADYIISAGEKLYDMMCGAGQEGIISKRVDATYRGRRSRNWLKIKCTRRQEFVIIGWRKSDKRGRPFASLLLAQNEGDELVYKGRVGTGFTEDMMEDLAGKMERLARKTAPAQVPKTESRDARWVTPKLVAEIAFAEFTGDGRVRHGSFLGLRSDKAASKVKPERPETHSSSMDGLSFKISSRDRIIFPEAKATKGDLADYYASIGALLLPWVAHRPISLVRCPQGRAKKCFFQKHDAGSFGDHVKAIAITEKNGGVADYLYLENVVGILACVQMGTIEFHGWGSRTDPLERPDRMVFDLDPDEGLDFDDVKKAAQDIHRTLADLGLVSFPMLSGGKGVHINVPLTPQAAWPKVKDFARRFSIALARSEPDRFTATMSKKKRKGKIFIDWLRNQRGSTSVAPYSVRARTGAPVAAPVTWDELGDYDSAGHFKIGDVEQLIDRANSLNLRSWGQREQIIADL